MSNEQEGGLTIDQIGDRYHKEGGIEPRDLFDIAQEECTEIMEILFRVILVSSKIKRFGIDDRNPTLKNSPTNRENLIQEIGDFLAVVDLLKEKKVFTQEDIDKAKELKRIKLKKLCGIE